LSGATGGCCGWPFALSAFALVAPLFLVLTDILQVAFTYLESQEAVRSRIRVLDVHGVPVASLPRFVLVPRYAGGVPMLSQPAFLILVAGHLVVAAAVLAGLRRTALAALVIAAAADYTQWTAFHVLHPGTGTIAFLTIAVFLLEVIALAAVDPRAARGREGWQHVFPALALAVAAQVLALSFAAPRIGDMMLRNGSELHAPSGNALLVSGCVLALLAVLLPLPLGLGWRASLLLAAACYPLVMLAATALGRSPGRLPQALGMWPLPAPGVQMVRRISCILDSVVIAVPDWGVARGVT
jgi:hypothetical protein